MSLRTLGFGLTLAAVSITVGIVDFLIVVHRGSREEVGRLLRLGTLLGGLALAGALLEWIGAARIFQTPALETLLGERGLGILMRLVCGVLVVIGLALDGGETQPLNGSETGRWVPGALAAVGISGVLLGVLSFSFDGHTVTEGPRLAHAALNVVHVSAGGVWVGGLVALSFLAWVRRRSTHPAISELVTRFSGVAIWALVVVGAAGVGMSLLIVDGVGDYLGTPWGRALLVKVSLVVVAAGVGTYNHFVTVRALDRDSTDGAVQSRARRALGLEATILVAVLAAAVILTTSSTNPSP